MKHPLRPTGFVLAMLVLLSAAAAGYGASPAAAAGPLVTVHVNSPKEALASGSVQLESPGEPPVKVTGTTNGELSKIECPGLGKGELPVDSVGAALLALADEQADGELIIKGLQGNGKLEFEGLDLPLQSISHQESEAGWQLWAGERYYDLGSGVELGLCAALQEGETVLLQGSDLVAASKLSEPSDPYSTDTPRIQIEGAPASVVVGQHFTVTVAAFQPREWDQSRTATLRTTGAGYSVSLDEGIPVQTQRQRRSHADRDRGRRRHTSRTRRARRLQSDVTAPDRRRQLRALGARDRASPRAGGATFNHRRPVRLAGAGHDRHSPVDRHIRGWRRRADHERASSPGLTRKTS